jgi:1-aminocyclopropane-1-carboxylate deaminase/D-cysteine desulfhydrase-like pyridoxal-dependent ACC family enzyme
VQALVKREDRTSPIYGGNKVRKLEFLLAGSAGPVVTAGGVGSHHVLATALHARSLGRDGIAILVAQPSTPHTDAVLDLNLAHCAEVIRLDALPGGAAAVGRAVASTIDQIVRRRAATPIFPGGSTPTGVLGYVDAGLELAEQIAAGDCPEPDAIYTALGSGGTAAGLSLGLGLAGLDCEIVAVRVATRLSGNASYVRVLARSTYSLLRHHGLRLPMPRIRVRVVHDWVGRGYGHPTAAGEDATRRARSAGLPCETTYTGKALAAMIAAIEADPTGGVRMFLDTYGPIDHLKQPRGEKPG